MTRQRARWMGVLALVPIVLFGLFFVVMFASVFTSDAFRPGAQQHGAPPTFLLLLFPMHCVAMVLWVTGLVLFIMDVFRNPRVAENLRPMWMVLFFFTGLVTVPVYWFLYIWQPLRGDGAARQVSP